MKPRVSIITVCNEAYADLGDIALPIMQKYCARHGYGLHLGKYETNPLSLPNYGDRGKIDLYNQQYDSHDIVCFLDIDVVIMNHDITIESVLGDRPFIWTYDHNGPCSGFWIARCTPEVQITLDAVKNRAPLMGNVRTVYVPGPPAKTVLEMEPTGQSDQETMRAIMHMPPYSRVLQNCVSGKEAGHCYDYRALKLPERYDYLGNYEPGDWLITFPSMPIPQRIEKMKAAARMVK